MCQDWRCGLYYTPPYLYVMSHVPGLAVWVMAIWVCEGTTRQTQACTQHCDGAAAQAAAQSRTALRRCSLTGPKGSQGSGAGRGIPCHHLPVAVPYRQVLYI